MGADSCCSFFQQSSHGRSILCPRGNASRCGRNNFALQHIDLDRQTIDNSLEMLRCSIDSATNEEKAR
jgi:hypothetical protein